MMIPLNPVHTPSHVLNIHFNIILIIGLHNHTQTHHIL
jgi:hypothetical protein